jgi:serine/threonine protein kinase
MTLTLEAPLTTLLSQAPLPLTQALRHALKLALALRSIHDRGQICGVLDPARIHLGPDQALIELAPAEFNPYTAPELLSGARPDARSDLFSLGAILYHLVAGRHPFACGSPAETQATSFDHFAAPLGLAVDGPMRAFEDVILGCLHKKPARRWQNARLICMELRLLNAAVGRLQPAERIRPSVEAIVRDHVSRLEKTLEARLAAFDFVLDEIRMQAATIEKLQTKAHRIDEFETALSSHSESIATFEANQCRTDDLLERLVESIDSLQSFVLERIAEAPSA